MNDTTNSLFEHIRNRLPSGYGLGDDEKVVDENRVVNHSVFQQSLREDHEGDVGIFETFNQEQKTYGDCDYFKTEVQIAVVTKSGDINSACKYLKEALNNLRTDKQSSHIWIKLCSLVNICPIGKNSNGYQMVEMNIRLKYLVNEDDE